MAGTFDFLHIKGRTAGSSNELSFDVLDAASQGLGEKKGRSQRDPGAPKPSQGSYHGVAGTSTLSAVPEVERRKRARRRRAARIWVIAIVSIVALVGSGVFFGYHVYQGKQNFAARFNQLIDRFKEIDQTMVEIDSLMADPLSSVKLVERAEVSERFATLTRELNAVTAEAHDMEPFAQTDHDRTALSEVEQAADARSNMIAAAESAFSLSKHANQLADEATEAWNKVLEGDTVAREATDIANAAKTEGTTISARDKTEQARELMSAARTELQIVEKEEPRVDLSFEKAYIDKRVAALDYAVETADALLANDRAAAQSANDAYNAADQEAARLGGALEDSPAEHVKSAYRSELDAILEDYTASRYAVTEADSALRSYL